MYSHELKGSREKFFKENKEVWVYADQAKPTVFQLCDPYEMTSLPLETVAHECDITALKIIQWKMYNLALFLQVIGLFTYPARINWESVVYYVLYQGIQIWLWHSFCFQGALTKLMSDKPSLVKVQKKM